MGDTRNARDPFLGLTRLFQNLAREQLPPGCVEGRVLSASPLKVRADGIDLDGEDLYIAQHLTGGWTEQLTGLSWGVTATLPARRLTGQGAEGSCYVNREKEELQGKTAASGEITHSATLKEGDDVLLLRSADGQTYYLMEKLVKADGESVSSD